ncbi:hypothetical protein TNCT_629181 [Trichonephila clavata]|uniref:Uncharacterized protein n=1 Tax=Trichonephila clavata TaxID=2740835 RepID=A0A8X6EZZ4_TRICU|nr:hypothetical protein TNCT_629181 [Trichonephila clavata]
MAMLYLPLVAEEISFVLERFKCIMDGTHEIFVDLFYGFQALSVLLSYEDSRSLRTEHVNGVHQFAQISLHLQQLTTTAEGPQSLHEDASSIYLLHHAYITHPKEINYLLEDGVPLRIHRRMNRNLIHSTIILSLILRPI